MYQGFAARTLAAQNSVETDEDGHGSASQPMSLTADPDTGPAARTARHCQRNLTILGELPNFAGWPNKIPSNILKRLQKLYAWQ